MESAAPEKQNVAKSQFYAVNILLAVSTTLVIGLEVSRHWGSYGWFNKFIGVILVLNLLGSLLELVRKKEKIAVEALVTSTYMCLMLATILFGH